jgi:hypothetical protein
MQVLLKPEASRTAAEECGRKEPKNNALAKRGHRANAILDANSFVLLSPWVSLWPSPGWSSPWVSLWKPRIRLSDRDARTRLYTARRQHSFQQRRMEQLAHAQGLTIFTRCACGCGLTIKPSIKRPFAPGHNKPGVLRVIPIRKVSATGNSDPVGSLSMNEVCASIALDLAVVGKRKRPALAEAKTNFCPTCRQYVNQNHECRAVRLTGPLAELFGELVKCGRVVA